MLSEALYRAGVWKAGDIRAKGGIPSGFPLLDGALPWKGWPQAALTEILSAEQGLGALRLVLPSMAELSHKAQWLIWVCPPHIPYVPSLQAYDIDLQRLLIIEPDDEKSADSEYKLWVFEQALRFQQCGLAVAWLDEVQMPSLRKLQLACEAGRTAGIIFRAQEFAHQASPALLRVEITAADKQKDQQDAVKLNILKARGLTKERHLELSL